MTHFPIEQALLGREGFGEPVLWVRSPGFREDWIPAAKTMILGFGNRPLGVTCPWAVFAHPFVDDQVVVVQVADRPGGYLGFHFLAMDRQAYEKFLGDPFLLARHFPTPWEQHKALPSLTWPAVPLPFRTVAEIQEVLQKLKAFALPEDVDPGENIESTTENSLSAALLGGVQALVDGGRLIFSRPGPDTDLLQGLWALLPASTRSQLWPASFAFGNELEFDALVVPRIESGQFKGYINEDQACEYPEGYYELNLQIATEAGDQEDLNALLNRRSSRETWRLGWLIVGILLLLVAGAPFLETLIRGPRPDLPPDMYLRAAAAAGVVGVKDPWTALGILQLGNQMWLNQQGEER